MFSRHSGFALETMTIDQLGRARQVRVNADQTAIIGGAGTPEDIEFRVTQLRAELERAQFGVDEDVLTERIGALTGKVAVIKVPPWSSPASTTRSRRLCANRSGPPLRGVDR